MSREEVQRLGPLFVGKVSGSSSYLELLMVYSRTGTAALCLLSEHMTTIVQRLDIPVPRKNAGSSLHDKGLERFYNGVYTAFLRLIPFSTLRVVILASPGFTKDALYDYIFAQATKANNKALLQARNKFLRVNVTSPHVHSLVEVLKSPEVSGFTGGEAKEELICRVDFEPIEGDEIRQRGDYA